MIEQNVSMIKRKNEKENRKKRGMSMYLQWQLEEEEGGEKKQIQP